MFRTLEPQVRRNLLILLIVGLLFWASLGSLLPTLSLYIKEVGATNQQVGLVMGSFAIGLVAFRPRLGRLADLRGRKLVLLIGVVVVAVAPIGYLFFQSVPLLMATRAFHGISIAAFTTAYSALVVDLSPEKNRGELLGYMSLVNPIGVAIGPAMGGILQQWAGYTPLFLLAASLGFVGLGVLLWLVVPPTPVAREKFDQPQPKRRFWKMISSPRLRIPALVMLLIGIAFGTLSTFVPLLIQETGVDFNAGFFYAAAAVASFSVRLLTGRASDRYGRGRFISLSLVLYTAAMLLIWVAQSPAMFLLAGVMEGAGAGILLPMMVALVADRSHPNERGQVFGLCLTGFDVGMAIAGPTLGYFADSLGYRTLFGLSGSLTFLALVIFVSFSSKNFQHSLRFSLGRGRDFYALPGGEG